MRTTRTLRILAGALALALAVGACGGPGADKRPVRVGSKNFTEQLILAEMMAQLIETRTTLEVERRFNLGGTMICHAALVNGDIDVYPEYTGTALTAVLEREPAGDAVQVRQVVATAYASQYGATWLPPLGFNNTYALTVRQDLAAARGWTAISDLEEAAADLRAGFTAEFFERPDGYAGLQQAYGFGFGEVSDLAPGLMYQAAAAGEVDVICAFATDGRIDAFDLTTLKDDAGFFPPYEAAPVARTAALSRFPQLRSALAPLGGVLSNEIMRQLNLEVDEGGRTPAEVARGFLAEKGFLAHA